MSERILEDISKWPIEKRRAKLEQIYEQRIGIPLNLDNPKRMTEKTQWRKLYENDPRITRCINKLTFKQYVRERLGDGYTAQIIDVWHSPDDVNILGGIPDHCVLKSNCSSDGKNVILIHNKADIDTSGTEEIIKTTWFDRLLLHTNSFMSAYYPVKPCVIVEDLIAEIASGVDEYKFFCFDGEPACVYHSNNHFCRGKNTNCSVSFFDLSWNNLGIQYGNHFNNPSARKPIFMNDMIRISRILSKDFSFVRVDFFETDEKFFLAEMAFTQGAGLTPYQPDWFDFRLGTLWRF